MRYIKDESKCKYAIEITCKKLSMDKHLIKSFDKEGMQRNYDHYSKLLEKSGVSYYLKQVKL